MTPAPRSPDFDNSRIFRSAKILLAPLGWHTRYMLRAYLVHVLIVALGLLTLALSIDLSPQISRLSAANRGAFASAAEIAWLAALRAADLLPRFLSFAAFLGVLWVELSHTVSRERVVIWNTGRSPVQCLTPLLLLGLILGILQGASDFYLRPVAMTLQIAQRLGSYGERYSREPTAMRTWLSAGNDLLLAKVDYGPPPVLRQVTVYRLNAVGQILEVDNAETASPANNRRTWTLFRGNFWAALPMSSRNSVDLPDAFATQAGPPVGTTFDRREIQLQLDPLRLSTSGISPIFLHQDVLQAISRSVDGAFIGNFQTWLQVRYGHLFLPGLMALLAGSMSLLLLAYQVRAAALLQIIMAGYVADLAARVFLLLGEQGYAQPVIAGWLVPALLAAAIGSLLAVSEVRRRSYGGRDRFQPLGTRREEPR